MRRSTLFEIMKMESQKEAVTFMDNLSFAESNVVSAWSIEGPKRVVEHYNKKTLTGLYLLLKAIDKAIKDKNNG